MEQVNQSSGYTEIYNDGTQYKKLNIYQVYRRPIVLFITDSDNNIGILTINFPLGSTSGGKVVWFTGNKILKLSVKDNGDGHILIFFKQNTAKITTSIFAYPRIGYYTIGFGSNEISNEAEFNTGILVTDIYP